MLNCRICVDPIFPPPEGYSLKKSVVSDLTPENKFELVFDEKVDGPYLKSILKDKGNNIISMSFLLLTPLVETDEESCEEEDEPQPTTSKKEKKKYYNNLN